MTKIAIAHRTGMVPVGESSVIIAISSVHRKEALEVRRWLLHNTPPLFIITFT